MPEKKESGKFIKKRSRFAQVSNHCLQNRNLSLGAKGLYALIQSLIDIPDFTLYKSALQSSYCREGRDAFNRTWNELKENGYLKVFQIPDEKGRFCYEYELLDEPDQNGSENNENSSSSPYTENPYTVNPVTEKPAPNNTIKNNTNNKYDLSVNTRNFENTNTNDRSNGESYSQILKKINSRFSSAEGIAYEEQSTAAAFITVIADLYASADEIVRIGRKCYSKSDIIQKLNQISPELFTNMVHSFTRNGTRVKNARNYIITMLINQSNPSITPERKKSVPDYSDHVTDPDTESEAERLRLIEEFRSANASSIRP